MKQYLTGHTDTHNDCTASFSEVVGMFVMLRNLVHNIVIRAGCVTYGKSSCRDYMIRRRKYGPLIKELHQMYLDTERGRRTILPECLPSKEQGWVTLPYIHRDKFVFYSTMANMIVKLLNKYENLRRPFPLFSLIYCCTMCNSVHYFYYMVEQMMEDPHVLGIDISSPYDCPDTELCVLMCQHMHDIKKRK